MRLGTIGAFLLVLSACAGPGGRGAETVFVADDTFYVTIDAPTVTVRNFATGVMNQTRLDAHARQAIAQVSPCTLTDFRQEPGVNTYTGTLTC